MDPMPQAQLSHKTHEGSPVALTERDQNGKPWFLVAKLDKVSDYARDRIHARKNWKEAFAWARENLTNARDSAWKRAHRKGIQGGEHTLVLEYLTIAR
ncbi:hypothetical protein H4R35_002541 [Dimargaris xerosporica]|nr:hypothetical protein H4R35_002541 [Dimargaris xerosporica]